MALIQPVCPPGWTCNFTPPPIPKHYYAHWWYGGWGIFVAILVVIALAIVLIWIVEGVVQALHEHSEHKQNNIKAEREDVRLREERTNRLAIEEQRTMQIDACDGHPELLKLVRDLQKG